MRSRPALAVLSILFALGADGPGGFRLETRAGKVVTFAEALAKRGLPFDKEPVAKQVVLLGDDGSVSPLLSDDASRALFADARLRNRKTELQARIHPGLPYLQVVSFKVEEGGRMRTPEYYCEICSISVCWDQDCPCCQGALIFRMKPDRP